MGEKIVIGPINKGLRNDRTAFNIDNDSFPTLINAYQWRGRVKRKRGTALLGRLNRNISPTFIGLTTPAVIEIGINLIIQIPITEANTSYVPGTAVVFVSAPDDSSFTDNGDGTLTVTGKGNSATSSINYTTGLIILGFNVPLTGGASIFAGLNYYPNLPVMGLEDFNNDSRPYPETIAFDTKYSYNITVTDPYPIYDISFYKNVATGTYPGYVQKTSWTPTTWNGQDYQQFWTVNYQNAFWATNGINIPFSVSNIGMQYKAITGVVIDAAGPPALATLTIVAHGLVQGDFVFINEVGGITGINFQTGYVVSADPQAANTVQVEFPYATLGGAYTSGGIAQYLTNRSDTTKDSLRWYDGDPTDGNPTTPTLQTGKGWVNFAPPLSQSNFSIADLPAAQYYLVGARMIVPFKDRLLFIGPVVQTSSAGSQKYLQDTVIYSQNGTPYYTASFTGDPALATTVFHEILVPADQTATATAYWEDQTGFGGFQTAGIDQPITSSSNNEDVLIFGFTTLQARFIYTGNDVVPFNFFVINSELGTGSTFSTINLDKGVMTRGERGFVIASQVEARRFDLEIPDQVFQLKLTENGSERVCSQRDFINEWVYFTYPVNSITYKFPNQTLQYNYRDDSWAIFYECYTTYGSFRKVTGLTWATIGNPVTGYARWDAWDDAWNAGESTLLQPEVIAGNQQGFVLIRATGTDEEPSLYIQNITGSIVTSPDHCLNNEDYIMISGAIGTISTEVNDKIFSVSQATQNTFVLNPLIGSGTYVGGGLITRMYVPYIQTKQFPAAWGMAKKTRIGVQRYLLTKTDTAQITLLIFLSQNDQSPYNEGPILPSPGSLNDSLIYSTVLYTCPESTNLGLTPANINLNMVTASQQSQIWHRINTSLIGDTVQLGFTLSDAQMREVDEEGSPISQFDEIELHGIIIDVSPSMELA